MIKPLKDSINSSIELLSRYQSGEERLIKTNREWLDKPGGVLRQSIILILGASFSGKTTELQNITDDIMSIDTNPDARDYVVCTHSLEMSSFSLSLKDIKKVTKKDYKSILGENFGDEDKAKLKAYFDDKRDGRYYINHETGTAQEIVAQTEEFLKQHTDKRLCLIEVDHLALLKSSQGNKKMTIDDLVEMMNDLKLKYPNFLLIALTQANRNIYSRISPKSNDMKLSRNDVYASDTAYHIADYCYGLQNAYFLGVEEYRKIRPDKYPHLEHRFSDEDSNGKVSLYSSGCIFVEVLKDRMVDDLDFVDIYTIEIKPFEKENTISKTTSSTNMPVFSKDPFENSKPLPGLSPAEAFGDINEEDTEDTPF